MPIKSALIIGYSRPSGVHTLLNSLKSNHVERVYVSIDGPRNESDKINQDKIQEILKDFKENAGLEVFVKSNVTNLGVAAGVLSAIDWFFSNEEEGLILEDDLVVGDDFYRFASVGLEKFSNDSTVWMISGTQLFPNQTSDASETWTNYPMIWGWAGWAKKWRVMRVALLQPKKVPVLKLANPRHLFWSIGANRALNGKVDTWDIPLAYEFWSLGKICILPPVNLISNVGDDDSSTHTSSDNSALRQKIQVLPKDFQYSGVGDLNEINSYNHKLESTIFRVRRRHFFLPYYSVLLDWWRFPVNRRKRPLRKRTDWDVFKAP
jgi:hypothetical protein